MGETMKEGLVGLHGWNEDYPNSPCTLPCITPNIADGHIPNTIASTANGPTPYISRRVTSLGASIIYGDIAP